MKAWNTKSIVGLKRFLEKVWKLGSLIGDKESSGINSEVLLHKTIKKVTEDIEDLKFNTAISELMIFVKNVENFGISEERFENFIILLAPFAPISPKSFGETWP